MRHSQVTWQGPREDSGGLFGTANPGVSAGISLVEKIYCYAQQKHPKSKVMATGIRHKTGMALRYPCVWWRRVCQDSISTADRCGAQRLWSWRGVDFMTVSPAVWEQLNGAATLQGYNDGFTASSGESGLQQRLSKEVLLSALALCQRSACFAPFLRHLGW